MTTSIQLTLFSLMVAGCVGPKAVDSAFSAVDTAPKDTGPLDQTGSGDLVDPDAWVLLTSSSDPFPDHRTDTHTCDPRGVHPEDGVLEIETNDCGYAVVGQPLLRNVREGNFLELLFYHSTLSSTEEGTEAHVYITVDGHPIWELNTPIPASSEVYIVPLTVDWSADAGAEVLMHLHNHGGNSYRFGYLKGGPPTTP